LVLAYTCCNTWRMFWGDGGVNIHCRKRYRLLMIRGVYEHCIQ
jgi:hypothetical protein